MMRTTVGGPHAARFCAARSGAARSRSAWVRAALVALLCCLLPLTGCSWVSGLFGDDPQEPESATVSVFDVAVGECFQEPEEVRAELSELVSVPCDQKHRQESYAVVDYQAPEGADPSLYPGDSALTTFAEGACAQEFQGYVGVSYLDSSLYFTYLLPSARGWQAGDDRSVVCFAITTGKALTTTVKGSKL